MQRAEQRATPTGICMNPRSQTPTRVNPPATDPTASALPHDRSQLPDRNPQGATPRRESRSVAGQGPGVRESSRRTVSSSESSSRAAQEANPKKPTREMEAGFL
ncbi:hypothetical protein LR48_Vigan01g073800 [Vigna angularis]|uniref:Uncharacterized protein n=1 Tax=Phaseolus angularis TaxID=3914 RepID=A0A0L9TKR8_PHAAN|nr:hypothetical protein LR48_Vigan01g073800 [Vigna angularis]